MNRNLIIALTLAAGVGASIPADAATTKATPAPKMHKAINSSHPGSPGYTNSSPLGSAEKAEKKEKKRAAKKQSSQTH